MTDEVAALRMKLAASETTVSVLSREVDRLTRELRDIGLRAHLASQPTGGPGK